MKLCKTMEGGAEGLEPTLLNDRLKMKGWN
jgi:hypothetical protein